MPNYVIEAEARVRRIYYVTASNEVEARLLYDAGLEPDHDEDIDEAIESLKPEKT